MAKYNFPEELPMFLLHKEMNTLARAVQHILEALEDVDKRLGALESAGQQQNQQVSQQKAGRGRKKA